MYNPGDFVVLVDKRPVGWGTSGRMDEFLSTVQCIYSWGPYPKFSNSSTWSWNFRQTDIVRLATEEEKQEYLNVISPSELHKIEKAIKDFEKIQEIKKPQLRGFSNLIINFFNK